MKTDYTQFTKEQLQGKIIDIEMRIRQSYGMAKKEKPENRKKLRKEIARIMTEINKK